MKVEGYRVDVQLPRASTNNRDRRHENRTSYPRCISPRSYPSPTDIGLSGFYLQVLEDPVTRATLTPPERRTTSPVMIAKQLSAKISSKILLSKQIRAIFNALWCESGPREASYCRLLVPYSTVVLPNSPLLYMYDVLTAARAVHILSRYYSLGKTSDNACSEVKKGKRVSVFKRQQLGQHFGLGLQTSSTQQTCHAENVHRVDNHACLLSTVYCLLAQVFEEARLEPNCKRDFLLPPEAFQDRSPRLSMRHKKKKKGLLPRVADIPSMFADDPLPLLTLPSYTRRYQTSSHNARADTARSNA